MGRKRPKRKGRYKSGLSLGRKRPKGHAATCAAMHNMILANGIGKW